MKHSYLILTYLFVYVVGALQVKSPCQEVSLADRRSHSVTFDGSYLHVAHFGRSGSHPFFFLSNSRLLVCTIGCSGTGRSCLVAHFPIMSSFEKHVDLVSLAFAPQTRLYGRNVGIQYPFSTPNC